MKLPNHERAWIPQAKITEYLLSFTHRDGRHKAEFFVRFDFTAASWETLAAALLRHAADHEVAKIEESPFGRRYVVEGELQAPDGRAPLVRTVWFIEIEGSVPWLVTAYPIGRRT